MRTRITIRPITLLFLLLAPLTSAQDLPVRLGTTVEPLFQSIHLELDPRRDDYRGSTRFALRVNEPVDQFRFHAEEMTIERLRLEGAGGAVAATYQERPRGEILVTAERPLDRGDYTLTVDFSNDFGSRTVGLYKVGAGEESSLYTQFQANDAREAIPVWDEPVFKIPFEVSLTIPRDLDAVSNTPVREVVEKGSVTTHHFERTPPLPSYLLALAVGEFAFVPIEGMSIPGRVVVPEGAESLGAIAAEMTPPLLREMEAYFNLRYPYEKLDLISVPDFWAGAMENAGAITFRDTILLLDPGTATPQQKRLLAKVIAHELAHMWFGDLVTMEWWNDLWLNESFADWFGDKIAARVFPEYEIGLTELQSVQGIMAIDANPSTREIRRPVDNPEAVLDMVGLAYSKGKAILTMFEQWIGRERFQESLRQYMRNHAWGTATSDEFFDALSAAAGEDVEPAMRSFLDQPSLPMIEVEVLEDGRVRLSQRRFQEVGAELENRSWILPVVLTYGVGGSVRTARLVVDEPVEVIELEQGTPEWVLPDHDATGYYRWSVGREGLVDLAERADEVMSPRQRMAFLGNAEALLTAGEIDAGTYLELLREFSGDDHAVVAQYVLRLLDLMADSVLTRDNRSDFARYVRSLVNPMLERFGREQQPGESYAVTALRPTLIHWLGSVGEDQEILDWAAAAARDYLRNPASVSPAIRRTVLSLAAMDGDRELFDRYRRELETAESSNVRSDFLAALGSFSDAELRETALNYALEGPLRSNEITALLFQVGQGEGGRAQLWDWVRENYAELSRRIPPHSVPRLVAAAGECNPDRLREAKQFFTGDRLTEGVSERLQRLEDRVTQCMNMRARHLESVEEWLRNADGGGRASGPM